jgi:hypothetical protein
MSDLSEPEMCSPTANLCRRVGVELHRGSRGSRGLNEQGIVGRTRRRRARRRAMSLAVACLVVSGVASVVGATASSAATAAPYSDPNVVGYIGLCDQAGQQITSGSITTAPFVWRAVSSQAAPDPYNGAGATAILNAYLPMQSLAPGDWSGEQLTASTRYSNPQSPMAQATARDVALQDFLQDYPPEWDGFIQLRLFLGAQNEPADVQHYAALDLQISGTSWTAVGGGAVNCNAGSAESLETVLAPPATTTTVAASGIVAHDGTTTTTASDAAGHKRPAAAVAAASGDSGSSGSDHLAAAQPQRWSHSVALYITAVLLLALVALSILLLTRRRRVTRVPSIASRTSVKGPHQ